MHAPLSTISPHLASSYSVLPEEESTPLWELILEQFKDQYVAQRRDLAGHPERARSVSRGYLLGGGSIIDFWEVELSEKRMLSWEAQGCATACGRGRRTRRHARRGVRATLARSSFGARPTRVEADRSLTSCRLVIILLASAAISFVLAFLEDGDDKATAYVEPIVILLILIANAIVGVVQETNAEKAIEVRIPVSAAGRPRTSSGPRRARSFSSQADSHRTNLQALMKYTPDSAKVTRDGRALKVAAADVVPGDIITVAVGDKIAADARVVQVLSASFTVDQALLTGESQSVSKGTATVKDEDAVKQDMVNMLFSVRFPALEFEMWTLTRWMCRERRS